jgi:hypothetical protein
LTSKLPSIIFQYFAHSWGVSQPRMTPEGVTSPRAIQCVQGTPQERHSPHAVGPALTSPAPPEFVDAKTTRVQWNHPTNRKNMIRIKCNII